VSVIIQFFFCKKLQGFWILFSFSYPFSCCGTCGSGRSSGGGCRSGSGGKRWTTVKASDSCHVFCNQQLGVSFRVRRNKRHSSDYGGIAIGAEGSVMVVHGGELLVSCAEISSRLNVEIVLIALDCGNRLIFYFVKRLRKQAIYYLKWCSCSWLSHSCLCRAWTVRATVQWRDKARALWSPYTCMSQHCRLARWGTALLRFGQPVSKTSLFKKSANN